MSAKKLLYIILSLLVAVLLMWLLLRQVDPSLIKKTVLGASIPALSVFVLVHLLSVWLRTWRYKLLLRPLPSPWRGITLATLVRNSFDDLLPARIGSLSYIYVLNQRLGFPFESAASSFVVAFVLDFLTLGPFLLLALLAVGARGLPFSGALLAVFAAVFFILSALALWKLEAIISLAERGIQWGFRILHMSHKSWTHTVLDKLVLMRKSLGRLQGQRVLAAVLVQSFLIRLAKYLSVYFLLAAFLAGHGFQLRDVSFWKTILGLTGAEFTALLPIKGLGGFGTWEAAWTATFRLIGFPSDLAVVTGLGVHLATNLLEYGLGIAAILLLLIPYLRKKRNDLRKGIRQIAPD